MEMAYATHEVKGCAMTAMGGGTWTPVTWRPSIGISIGGAEAWKPI